MTVEELNENEIKDKIAELESRKENLSMELENFKRNIKLRRDKISEELRKLKNKIRWKEYAEKNYKYKDYSKSPSVQLFGKRKKDLTQEERKEYQRIMTQKCRKNRLKNNGG